MSEASKARRAARQWTHAYIATHPGLSRFELMTAAGERIVNQPTARARLAFYKSVWEDSLDLRLTSPY